MFVENYRSETAGSIMLGGDAKPIPYPRISPEDWLVWTKFLPFRSLRTDRLAGRIMKDGSLYARQGIPPAVTAEIRKATEYFDQVEVWRKQEVHKDPIAVGIIAGERYMIARWGMEELVPFDKIKTRLLMWNYATHPLVIMPAILGLVYLLCVFMQ